MTIEYILLWAVSLVLTILVAYYFYRKSSEKVELKIFYYNDSEVSKLSDENRKISVRYGDQIVDRVTTTRVWLWNNGARPLKNDDIPPNDPLTIVIAEKDKNEKIMILDYKVVKTSRACANFHIISTDKKSQLKLHFDYIDNKEGTVFEIQHTGTVECILKLDGVILGPKTEPNIRRSVQSFREAQSPSTKHPAEIPIMFITGIGFTVVVGVITKMFGGKTGLLEGLLIIISAILLLSIILGILFIVFRLPYPNKLKLP